MPARKISGVWHVDVWIDVPGQGRTRLRKRSPIQTKKGAQGFEAILVADALSPSTDREERRFEDFAIEFLKNYVKVQCKYSTTVTYESILNEHLVPFFKERELRTILARDVAELQAGLVEKKRSAKTQKNVLGVLSSALHVAMAWGYLEAVPLITLPKLPPPRFRFLTIEECLKLEAGSTPYWFVMIHLARKAGLRLGELCALEWEQMNLEAGTVLVDRAVWRGRVSLPKHDKIRTVDLSPKTVGLLRAMKESAREKLVFPSTEGRMRQERKCDQGLRRCAERAGLVPFGWHVLRHTYASHLVMQGEPIPVVQQLLGHADIRLTMRYAHLSPGVTTRAAAKLDEAEAAFGQPLGRNGVDGVPEAGSGQEKSPESQRLPGFLQRRGGRDSNSQKKR